MTNLERVLGAHLQPWTISLDSVHALEELCTFPNPFLPHLKLLWVHYAAIFSVRRLPAAVEKVKEGK